jgi:ribosomal protein S18 acetylase RimI-like enzyme
VASARIILNTCVQTVVSSMSDLSIHPIRENDIEFVYTLCKNESWNYSRKRIERVHHYEPNGCFVAVVNRKRVGHVFSISYGKVGWIGLMIVDKEHRRTGVGTLLMRRAINYLQNSGVETVKLEAVPKIAGLYRKLGFVDEFDSLRFKKVNERDNQSTNLNVKPLRGNQITETAEFDSRYFGANRTRVLRQLFEDNPELCFTSRKNSQIVGYIMCYEMETGYRIGPWICSPHHPKTAKGLILKCVQTIETNAKLYVGVPAVNNTSVKLLQDLGFELYCKSVRMYLGKKHANEHAGFIFSIGGPENG